MDVIEDLKSKYGSLLLSPQAVAKELGVTKADVKSMLDMGSLKAITAGTKTLISTIDLAALLGQSQTENSGGPVNGYPQSEEIDSLLTKNEVVVEPNQEEETQMLYTGSISTLKDGRLMVQINKGKTREGKRKRESKSFRDENEAQAYLDKRLAVLNRGNAAALTPQAPTEKAPAPTPATPPPAPMPYYMPQNPYAPYYPNPALFTNKTFEQYSKDLLNEGVGKGRSRTREGYRLALVNVNKYIGDIPMVDIDAVAIRRMFEKLALVQVRSTLRKTFNTTKMIFEIAYDNGEIPQYPFRRIKCPTSQKVSDKERHPYTDEEINTILTRAKEYPNPFIFAMFALLECTGMRPGEMRALEWKDFDAKKKTIHINKAIGLEFYEIEDMNKTGKSYEIVKPPKTPFSVRTLRLSDMAVDALLAWKKELNNSPSPMKNSKYIFTSKTGEFNSQNAIKCLIQRFVEKYSLEGIGISLYRFRHTMCTRLILAGQPLSVIQRIMGDNTTDVILRVYTHVSGEQAMAACDSYYDNLNEKHREITMSM